MKSQLTSLLIFCLLLFLTACNEEVAAGVLAGSALVYVLGSIFLFLLVIYALYDLYNKPYAMPRKLLWALIILIVPVLGAIGYLFTSRSGATT